MPKFDDDENFEVVPVRRNVIAPNRNEPQTTEGTRSLPVSVGKGSTMVKDAGEAVAETAVAVANPVLAVVDTALKIIPDICTCISTCVTECQKTKQVQAKAMKDMEVARQETARVQIEQVNKTERYLAKCNKEIRLKEIELSELREKCETKKYKMDIMNQQFGEKISDLRKIVNISVESLSEQVKNFSTFMGDKDYSSYFEAIDSYNQSLNTLITLAQQISNLKVEM